MSKRPRTIYIEDELFENARRHGVPSHIIASALRLYLATLNEHVLEQEMSELQSRMDVLKESKEKIEQKEKDRVIELDGVKVILPIPFERRETETVDGRHKILLKLPIATNEKVRNVLQQHNINAEYVFSYVTKKGEVI